VGRGRDLLEFMHVVLLGTPHLVRTNSAPAVRADTMIKKSTVVVLPLPGTAETDTQCRSISRRIANCSSDGAVFMPSSVIT
jgi:hypothetical protein